MDNVPSLRGLAAPLLSVAHLLFILYHWPGLGDIGLVIDLLCQRDIAAALRYFISLPYSHGHRAAMKYYLKRRLRNTPIQRWNELAALFPVLSALVPDETGFMVPRMGPLTDHEMGMWDANDFFLNLRHAKQMEGTIPFASFHCCMSFTFFSNAQLRFL